MKAWKEGKTEKENVSEAEVEIILSHGVEHLKRIKSADKLQRRWIGLDMKIISTLYPGDQWSLTLMHSLACCTLQPFLPQCTLPNAMLEKLEACVVKNKYSGCPMHLAH